MSIYGACTTSHKIVMLLARLSRVHHFKNFTPVHICVSNFASFHPKMEYLTFKNGRKMPMLGLGLFLASDPVELESAINEALKIGYRHFDTAYFYKNEAVLGKVLKEWLGAGRVKREELFITTKLPFHGNRPEKVEHFLRQSLASLELQYVDLYLIHNPVGIKYVADEEFAPREANGDIALDMETDLLALWAGMEAQVAAGRTLSIGVSNFNGNQLERIAKIAKIPPVNNQVECNLYFQQKELREVCKRLGVTMVAYGPLGSPGRTAFYAKMGNTSFQPPTILQDPVVGQIATKYGKSSGQILLRFLIQLGIAPIPKSVTPARLKQNFEVFDFKISDADMQTLVALDKDEAGRTFDMGAFKGVAKHPEFPFPRK